VKTVKPNEQESAELQKAARLLKVSNELLASAKKEADAAKELLAKWLKEKRDIDVEVLLIGEIVNIDGVCLIKKGKQNKFDVNGFMVAQPALHAEFKKDFPITKYEVLVS
jgi:hypothetical protein